MKVGDIVKIRKDSEYYHYNSTNNPRDIKGVIYYIGNSVEDPNPIKVEWENTRLNVYREKDLELVEDDLELLGITNFDNILYIQKLNIVSIRKDFKIYDCKVICNLGGILTVDIKKIKVKNNKKTKKDEKINSTNNINYDYDNLPF